MGNPGIPGLVQTQHSDSKTKKLYVIMLLIGTVLIFQIKWGPHLTSR